MKKLDRLIVSELLGPFMLGVAMFASLLLAATYLGRIAEYVAAGVGPELIGQISMLLLPPIFIKTFSMATLLGALLAFGRLSGDSEIVAMRAGGASLYRIIAPVAAFSLVVAAVSFILNDTLVPSAAKRATSLSKEVSTSLKKRAVQPTFQPQIVNNRVVATVQALDFSVQNRTLSGVVISSLDEQGDVQYVMLADQLRFENRNDWRIIGKAKLLSSDGQVFTELKEGLWPSQVPNPGMTPEEMTATTVTDPDFFTTKELREQIGRAAIDKSLKPEQVRDREYWLWNKYAVPLAAFVFGILGAALGIRSHRAGTATGFALAVGIMFGYMVLANFMNVWAKNGVIPPYVASFTPIVLGTVAALVITWRRNIG